MSRVGRKPIPLPPNVELSNNDGLIMVKGPKGQLTEALPNRIQLVVEDGTVQVTRENDDPEVRALHGLTRALVANMVTGVTDGFTKTLEMTGVGYRAQQAGSNLNLQVGYSHPVEFQPPSGVQLTVENPTRIVVSGIDKQAVGEMAARIRRTRKPEPYKGKGIRYSDEVIRRKAGKAGRAGA